jgi:predicted ATPase
MLRLDSLHIRGYRSVRDVELELGPVTVVVGANGTGKTNLYRGVYLLAAAASGQFARTLADEGGMPSVLWAGSRDDGPRRVVLEVRVGPLHYQLACGLPVPSETRFTLDPLVKEEHVWITERGRRVRLLERGNFSATARDAEGQRVTFATTLNPAESVLAQIREPQRFPELALLRQAFLSWRFYHQFRTDPEAPARHPQIGVRTPVLAHDGRDLAAALQTIRESANDRKLDEAISRAFPGSRLDVAGDGARFHVRMSVPGVARALDALELSDGTLRYLYLVAALLALDPAPLLALNEPETSLHPDLLGPLAELIADAASRAQIWVTTHAAALADALATRTGTATLRLAKREGATVVVRAVTADDDDPE